MSSSDLGPHVSTEPPQAPRFGPNGAVMNAPHLTEAMRRKLEAAERSQPTSWKSVAIKVAVFAAAILLGAWLRTLK